jgi:type VI protein secretion system component Hcp
MPSFLSEICDEKTLQTIGQSFGKKHPDQYAITNLKKTLLASVSSDQQEAVTDPATLSSLLIEKINHEFDRGQTLVLDGWVLSLTEARQCALFSLAITR